MQSRQKMFVFFGVTVLALTAYAADPQEAGAVFLHIAVPRSFTLMNRNYVAVNAVFTQENTFTAVNASIRDEEREAEFERGFSYDEDEAEAEAESEAEYGVVLVDASGRPLSPPPPEMLEIYIPAPRPREVLYPLDDAENEDAEPVVAEGPPTPPPPPLSYFQRAEPIEPDVQEGYDADTEDDTLTTAYPAETEDKPYSYGTDDAVTASTPYAETEAVSAATPAGEPEVYLPSAVVSAGTGYAGTEYAETEYAGTEYTGTGYAESPGPDLAAQYRVYPWDTSLDCFWNISARPWVYGDPTQWMHLYNANRNILPDPANPDILPYGVVLDIPSLSGETRQGTGTWNTAPN